MVSHKLADCPDVIEYMITILMLFYGSASVLWVTIRKPGIIYSLV